MILQCSPFRDAATRIYTLTSATDKNNELKLTFSVEAEKFDEAIQKVYAKSANYFTIPGFRKGKAPYKIVEKYSCEKYGDDYTMTSDNYCVKKGEKCTKKLEDYTEYQYRTRRLETINSVDVDYKWSTSNNDADLLAQDYKLTGNTK